MRDPQLLIVAGTHGNEINAPWLFSQLEDNNESFDDHNLKIFKVIGNPESLKVSKRYLDFDLNRSFLPQFISKPLPDIYEHNRAKYLLDTYGPKGISPCKIAIDLHSTTSSMGSSIVIYGRRPADLALASLIQYRLGLSVYLHELDSYQKGFLVESWPCGLVVEIGPVPQNLLSQNIVKKTRLVLQVCIEEIAKVKQGKFNFPDNLIVHVHKKSIDYPRDYKGNPSASIHSLLEGNDFKPIKKGDPIFWKLNGEVIKYKEDQSLIPVFINEAAYAEKNIAFSLTKKETWTFMDSWRRDLMIKLS